MNNTLSFVFPFGIHKGKTIKELLDKFEDYDYVVWCIDNVQGFKLDDEAFKYAKEKLKEHVARARESGELDDYTDWKARKELARFDDKLVVSHNKGE